MLLAGFVYEVRIDGYKTNVNLFFQTLDNI